MSGYKQYSEIKELNIDELHAEREEISMYMIEAEGEQLYALEDKLEEVEELIMLKEAGLEELDFE